MKLQYDLDLVVNQTKKISGPPGRQISSQVPQEDSEDNSAGEDLPIQKYVNKGKRRDLPVESSDDESPPSKKSKGKEGTSSGLHALLSMLVYHLQTIVHN